jgi:hypothetical protein
MGRILPARVMPFVGMFTWLLVGALGHPGAAQEPSPAAAAPSYAVVISVEDTAQPQVSPINPATWSGRTEYP